MYSDAMAAADLVARATILSEIWAKLPNGHMIQAQRLDQPALATLHLVRARLAPADALTKFDVIGSFLASTPGHQVFMTQSLGVRPETLARMLEHTEPHQVDDDLVRALCTTYARLIRGWQQAAAVLRAVEAGDQLRKKK